jgi:protein-S-isoprenylcysteine O-methyltransferase Ste14
MEQLLPKAVYFAGLVAEIVVRFPHERQRRHVRKADQRITRAERGLFAALSLAVFALPALYSLTPWLARADYPLSRRAKAAAWRVGALPLAAAVWLFWRAHRDLGTNWSPSLEIGAQHTLTTNGIYRTIRHPMYASQLLWGIAQALLLPNWIAGLGGLVTFLLLYGVRIPREEQMMRDHFGDAYRAYSAQTGRIVPRLRR